MKVLITRLFQAAMLVLVLPLQGAENNDGQLGLVSEGQVTMTLEVNHTVTAGLLHTNLDDPDNEFHNIEAYQLINGLIKDNVTTIPLCIFSNDGAAYSIDSFEIPGMENKLRSEFGASVPFDVTIGDGRKEQQRFRSISDVCNSKTAIPITIRTSKAVNGSETGRMNGQFNLLIKME